MSSRGWRRCLLSPAPLKLVYLLTLFSFCLRGESKFKEELPLSKGQASSLNSLLREKGGLTKRAPVARGPLITLNSFYRLGGANSEVGE
jgi:hypothetical protein